MGVKKNDRACDFRTFKFLPLHLIDSLNAELPYFPACKTHFFPRKMLPTINLHLMRRGWVLFQNL
jgi:hypothetical protein